MKRNPSQMKPSIWKLHVQPAWWDGVTNVYLRGYSSESSKSVSAKPIEFVEVEEGAVPRIMIPHQNQV